jgi:hypothetical protein
MAESGELNEGLVSDYLNRANNFLKVGMKNIKLLKKMIGTRVIVSRPKDNSKWKNVFGGSYSSDSTLETDYDQFQTILIINMNDMRDVWSRNRDIIETYSDEGNLEVGDEVQYSRNGVTYRYKIIQKQAFSEAKIGLYVYMLSTIIETVEPQ